MTSQHGDPTLRQFEREVAHLGSENQHLHKQVLSSREAGAQISREWAERMDHAERRNHELRHENAQLRHRLDVAIAECDHVKAKLHTALQASGSLLPATRQHFTSTPLPQQHGTASPRLPRPAPTLSSDIALRAAQTQMRQLQDMNREQQHQIQELRKMVLSHQASTSSVRTPHQGNANAGATSPRDVAATIVLQEQLSCMTKELRAMEDSFRAEQSKNADLHRMVATFEEAVRRGKEDAESTRHTFESTVLEEKDKRAKLQKDCDVLRLENRQITDLLETTRNDLEKTRHECEETVSRLVAERNRLRSTLAVTQKQLEMRNTDVARLSTRMTVEASTQVAKAFCTTREVQVRLGPDVKDSDVQHVPALRDSASETPRVVMYSADIQVGLPEAPTVEVQSPNPSREALLYLSNERDSLHIQLDDATLELNEARRALSLLQSENDQLQSQLGSSEHALAQLTRQAQDMEANFHREEQRAQMLMHDNAEMQGTRRNLARDMTEATADLHRLMAERDVTNQQLQDALKAAQHVQGELHDALQRESSLQNALQNKQSEYDELLSVYTDVSEQLRSETVKVASLEKSLQSFQAQAAQNAERLHTELQANQDMSRREELLSVDLQQVQYENTALHRRIDELTHQHSRWESHCEELERQISAAQKVNRELERTYNDLMRQHSLALNEVTLLKAANEDTSHEVTAARAACDAEQQRCRQLEDEINRIMLQELRTSSRRGGGVGDYVQPESLLYHSTSDNTTAETGAPHEEEVRSLRSELDALRQENNTLKSDASEMTHRLSAQQSLVQLLDEEARNLRLALGKK
eukprot:PhM_4_TR18413/c0_g1_i1/m.24650